jgi:hypothetical protein
MNKTVVTMLAVGALSTLTACPNMTGRHKIVAEDEAREWAAEISLNVDAISCREKDTDGDGYVSCAIKTKDGQIQGNERVFAFVRPHGLLTTWFIREQGRSRLKSLGRELRRRPTMTDFIKA